MKVSVHEPNVNRVFNPALSPAIAALWLARIEKSETPAQTAQKEPEPETCAVLPFPADKATSSINVAIANLAGVRLSEVKIARRLIRADENAALAVVFGLTTVSAANAALQQRGLNRRSG